MEQLDILNDMRIFMQFASSSPTYVVMHFFSTWRQVIKRKLKEAIIKSRIIRNSDSRFRAPNALKSDLKKPRICPIWGQSDPLWSQTYHPCGEVSMLR